MELKDIITLINAGYSKEDIEKLTAPKDDPKNDPPKDDPKNDPPKDDPKNDPPKDDPKPRDYEAEIAALKAQLKAAQEGNVKGANNNEPKKKTSAEVIADFFGTM